MIRIGEEINAMYYWILIQKFVLQVYILTQHWAVWVAAAKSVQSIDILAGVAASPEASNLCETPIRNRQVGESDMISPDVLISTIMAWFQVEFFVLFFVWMLCESTRTSFFRRYTL